MKILLGLSGGVDTTYAALKLKNEGQDVVGAVLKMHGYSPISDAASAAEATGIPLVEINCEELFEKIVVANFIDEYLSARTPNPCIICNSEVKFRELYKYAMENGFDAIATGHYAKIYAIDKDGNRYLNTAEFVNDRIQNGDFSEYRYAVSYGDDLKKDQSYMLWRLSQDILSRLVFPLSGWTKSAVRERSLEANLSAARSAESQEICFIPDGDYASFIEKERGRSPEGDFVDDSGRVLGRHKGLIRYTVGQRRGLGISAASRIFVTEINPVNNTITLSDKTKSSSHVRVSGIVYSGIEPVSQERTMHLSAKLRYAAPRVSADVVFYPSGEAEITLDAPVSAVTAGQSAVLYDGDLVVAGGFIDSAD
jgi:tRNA-specific 2-thiouridylase